MVTADGFGAIDRTEPMTRVSMPNDGAYLTLSPGLWSTTRAGSACNQRFLSKTYVHGL